LNNEKNKAHTPFGLYNLLIRDFPAFSLHFR